MVHLKNHLLRERHPSVDGETSGCSFFKLAQDKLAGSVGGVYRLRSTSGQPGAVESVRIRGMGSINAGNDPLYVIDGVPSNDW
ncbi:TonB-dependent receptor plug domain-containing protein, partial [Bacteroides fragilis]|nr:TonB-dependent receptor plug domain-containing protein [Bacteroides fragilis]